LSFKNRPLVGLPGLIYEGGPSLPDTGVTPVKWILAQGANLLTKSPVGTGAMLFGGLVEYTWEKHGVGIHPLGGLIYDPRPDSWLWQNTALNDIFGSSESSSGSYQQNGGSGGTRPSRRTTRFKNIDAIPAGSRVTKPTWKTTKTDYIGNPSKGYHYCKKGWFLVRVGDTNMCWKPPQKKKS